MAFGCKVNGEIFVPRDSWGEIVLYAQYIYLDDNHGKGWFLNISAVDNKATVLTSMSIGTDSLWLDQDSTYPFKIEKGFPIGEFRNYPNGSLNEFIVRNADSGQLFITKHDVSRRILAGRFWFDATNEYGKKVQIREGRFDVVY